MATQPSETGGNLLNGQTLLDGFGFLEGQLIGNAPMVFPGEQQLFMILELTAEFGGAFGPIGEIVALIAEIIILILELIDFLVAFFEGVPRSQKTAIVAKRFANGKSPISQLVSAQIYQLLNYQGVVLSSSLPADQTTFGEIRHQAEVMLQALGASQQAAQNAINHVWNNTTSADEPLPNILNQLLPQGWLLVGNKIIQQMYIDHYNQLISQGSGPKNAAKKATQYVLHHAPQKQLLKIRLVPQPGYNPCQPGFFFDSLTGKCLPGNPLNPPPCPPGFQRDPSTGNCIPVTQPQQCPVGYIWDPTTSTCIVDPNQPNPCQPANDGTNDGLGDGLDCISQNLLNVQYQLRQIQQELTGQGGQPTDPVTCTQLGGYVSTINVSLQAIVTAIATASSAGAPIDLSAITTQLSAIADALRGLTGAGGAAVNVNLTSSTPLATATATAPATDLTQVVEMLKQLVREADVSDATFQYLAQQGFLTGDDIQFFKGMPGADAFFAMLRTIGFRILTNFLSAFGVEIVAGKPKYVGLTKSWSDSTAAEFAGAIKLRDTAITPVVTTLISAIVTDLKAPGATQIGVIGVDPDKPVSDAIGIALSAGLASYLLAFVGIDEGEPLAHLAELVSGAVGFEELRDVKIGPLIRNGIGKIAEMQARATFKQEIPGTSELGSYVAMGLLDPARRDAIAQFNGTPDELAPIIARGQFRGMNPRQLLRLVETGLFSEAEIADELTFSAMRPVSQHRMLLAAPYLATAAERSSLRAAAENAATAGLLSDDALRGILDSGESNTDRDSLLISRVHLQQLVANAKALEAEYSALFKVGLMTDDAFRGALAAIGLQQWAIDMVAAKAEVQANVALQKKTLAAEAALERATENKARAAAVKAFTTGTIDEAALSAALLATGLTAAQAAFWVTQAVLQKGGALRWLYGLQLSPSEATLLRERVSALTDQRKRLQITDAEFVAALQALGIHARYINALRAAADAMISPKTSAVVIPVQTN